MIEMTPEKITLRSCVPDRVTEITAKTEIDVSEYSHASGPNSFFLAEKWREELATKLAKAMIDEDLIHIDIDLSTTDDFRVRAEAKVKFIQE